MLTQTLRDGTVVLAKQTKHYGICAYTFANRTHAIRQALRAQLDHPHIQAEVIVRGRPFFVRITPKGGVA